MCFKQGKGVFSDGFCPWEYCFKLLGIFQLQSRRWVPLLPSTVLRSRWPLERRGCLAKKAVGSKNWKKLLQNLPHGRMLVVEEKSEVTKIIGNAPMSWFPFWFTTAKSKTTVQGWKQEMLSEGTSCSVSVALCAAEEPLGEAQLVVQDLLFSNTC